MATCSSAATSVRSSISTTRCSPTDSIRTIRSATGPVDVHDLPVALALLEHQGLGARDLLAGGFDHRFGRDPGDALVRARPTPMHGLLRVSQKLRVGGSVLRKVLVARMFRAAGFEHQDVFGEQLLDL